MENNKGNHTARIGECFNSQLEEIKKARIEKGLDKFEISTRALTELIVKHNAWPSVKCELIDYTGEIIE